nr:TraM recognition domain-containing protein [Achromobacter ruhlandii]
MSKINDIWDIMLWIGQYVLYGGLVVWVSLLFVGVFLAGYLNFVKAEGEEVKDKISILRKKIVPSLGLFEGFGKLVDKFLEISLKTVSKTWMSIIPDSLIESIFRVRPSFSARLARAKQLYPRVSENEFFWARLRATDFREISPVVHGLWWNNKPVEEHVSFLLPAKAFYNSVKLGVLAGLLVFVALAFIYKPQWYFGFQTNYTASMEVNKIADAIKNDISIVPAFNKDYWDEADFKSAREAAIQEAPKYAAYVVGGAQGYNYQPWGFIFKNGLLLDLFMGLAVAIAATRILYFRSYKLLQLPVVKNNHEIFVHEKTASEVADYKRTVAAANKRATGFDKNMPLVVLGQSTGGLEESGVLGAKRKAQKFLYSISDMSQNTLVTGSTGSNKTRAVAKPVAEAVLTLKSINYAAEQKYEELFDLRTNTLTQKAIDSGYLERFIPIAQPKFAIGMALHDLKAQIHHDMRDIINKLYLNDSVRIIGAESGQFGIDLLATLGPTKLVQVFESIGSQLGGEKGRDFWVGSALIVIKNFAKVIYVFARTTCAKELMRKNRYKAWSLKFLAALIQHDANGDLLALMVKAIYDDMNNCPERIADLMSDDVVNAISYLYTKWADMPEETKGGIITNITFIMDSYSGNSLDPFLEGVGENMVSIEEIWTKIVAVDLPSDKYGVTGKVIQLFIKTLQFETAVGRQMFHARRITEISEHFRQEYPDLLVLEPSIETLTPALYSADESKSAHQDYLEICAGLQEESNQVWTIGSYATRLREICASMPDISKVEEDLMSSGNHEQAAKAEQALKLAARVKELEPRFAKSMVGIIDGLDTKVFESKISDSAEEKAKKRNNLHLYYQFLDSLTRVTRERMVFLADEYQGLITVDKTGVCLTDFNTPNIVRSTGLILFIITQSYIAFEQVIGKEATHNFIAQMRNRVYLASEDASTRDDVVKLVGKAYIFEHALKGKPLLANGKPTGIPIYANLNALISSEKVVNASHGQAHSTVYPYSYDILTDGNPIEVDISRLVGSGLFTGTFSKKELGFDVPDMIDHFFNPASIEEVEKKGSASQGVQSNLKEVKIQINKARVEAADKYNQFIKDAYNKGNPAVTEEAFMKQSNIHAVVVVQRAGMMVVDHIIIAKEEDYVAA